MVKHQYRILIACIVSMMLVLSGCSDGGGSGDANSAAPATTQVSGKVTLSSVVSGGAASLKPSLHAKRANEIRKSKARIASNATNAKSKAGRTAAARSKVQLSKANRKTRLDELAERVISRAPVDVLSANVYLFDADHPEWLKPVAQDQTDVDGYSLDVYMNAADNGNAYVDGAPIPSGNYTLVAVGKECSDTILTSKDYPFVIPLEDGGCEGNSYRFIVGVQAVVEKFAGAVENSLVVQRSDAKPKVVAVMGEKLNALATNASGEYELAEQAMNNKLQVVFNMAMLRSKAPNAITLTDASDIEVAGVWRMSPDLTVATFEPATSLVTGEVYKITIDNTKVANYFGKGLKDTVIATYTTKASDLLAPDIVSKFPENKAAVDISTYIMVEFDETVDTNDMTVFATTKDGTSGAILNAAGDALGAKPAVKPMGNNRYQILPGVSLELNRIYDIELKGVKDLAGNEMTSQAAWNIVTNSTSEGVDVLTDEEKKDPALVAQVEGQANVKRVIGGWVNAINNSDLGMFGALLTPDFTMQYEKQSKCSREDLSTCSYDINKDGALDYTEFLAFIEGWFSENAQMQFPDPSDTTGETFLTFTGDDSGIFIQGDAQVAAGENIDVDVASGTAAFKFNMTYHYGTAGTAIGADGDGEINLFLGLVNLNGAWMISSISDREIGAIKDVSSLLPITQVTPIVDLVEGTRDIDFTFTPLAAGTVSSYAVIMYDRNDPSDETGWLTVVDAANVTVGTDVSVRYTQTADKDAADGQVTLVGGVLGSPFERELGALTDGGRYSWTVIGFETLTAADFVAEGGLQKAPEGDMLAWSKPTEFSIGGAFVQDLTVTLQDADGASLSFDGTKGAWDAGTSSSMTIVVASENATEGKVFVSGLYYSESAFTFETDGTATVTVPLYEGFNWVEVNVGSNWWFAASPRNNSVYTSVGVQPKEMIVTSVSADGTALTRNRYGEYAITTLTTAEMTIVGTSTPLANLHFDISGQTATGSPVFESRVVTAGSTGAFEATLPVYAGFNWVGVWDEFGGWMDFGVNNQSTTAATYTAPFSAIAVTDSTGTAATFCASGSTHTNTDGSILNCWNDTYIVDTPLDVTIAGTAGAKNGSGRWWSNNFNFGTWFDGGLAIDAASGNFSFPLTVFPGENAVGFEDVNFNFMDITIVNVNTSVQAPHEITGVLVAGTPVTVSTYDWGETYYDVGTACSVTITGSSSGSAGKLIHGDVFNNGNSEFIEVTADAAGSYEAIVNVYGGNMGPAMDQGENWVNMNDARGIWQGTRILSTCTTVPVGLELISVTDGTVEMPLVFDPYGGEYRDAAMSNAATLSGTAKPGAEIIVHVNGSGYREKRITVLADGTWSTAIDLFPQDNWVDVEQGGNWRFTQIRTQGGLDCSMAPCSDMGFSQVSALYISDPFNGATNVGVATVTAGLDLAMFPLFGQEVVRAKVTQDDGTSFSFSSDATEAAVPGNGLITFNTTSGDISFGVNLNSAIGAEIGVGVWGSVMDSPDFVQPIHGARIGVNGFVVDNSAAIDCAMYPSDPACGGGGFAVDCQMYPSDPACGGTGGGVPMLGANPPGSTAVMITGPTNGAVALTTVNVIATVDPAQIPVGGVVRLMVMDPMSGGPSLLMSSDIADMYAMNGTFTMDGAGNINVPIMLSGAMKEGIFVSIWSSAMDDPSMANPVAGYYIEVN